MKKVNEILHLLGEQRNKEDAILNQLQYVIRALKKTFPSKGWLIIITATYTKDNQLNPSYGFRFAKVGKHSVGDEIDNKDGSISKVVGIINVWFRRIIMCLKIYDGIYANRDSVLLSSIKIEE